MSYKALLFCPEEKTARVVTQVLTELDFHVEPCSETFAAVKKLMAEHFDAIVVDCDNEQNAAVLFKSAHNSGVNQKSLAVAVVEGQAGVAKAFRIGANLVLTKPINVEQSKGTLRVARGLLRKTESAKPVAGQAEMNSSAMSGGAIGRAAGTDAAVSKTRITSLPVAPLPSIPTAAASAMFEVEQEPAPKPEPTEAAFLESMSDPLADTKHIQPASAGTSKEFPWQPASKPMSETMTSALRRAAEVAGEPEEESAASASMRTSSPAGGGTSFSSAASFGSAAAAAPAMAKEPPLALEHEAAEQPEAPLFSAVTGGRDSTEDGGSKKGLIIAAVVLIAIGAGYFGWSKMHSGASVTSLPAAPKTSLQTQPQAAAPAIAAPATVEPSPVTTPSQTTASSPVEQGPDITLSAEPTPAPPKASSTAPKQSAVAKQATPQPAPLMVKGGSVARPSAPQAAADAPAPGMLALDSGSGDQGISGIVGAPTASVAQAAPQTLKISQGVAQGLLMKRVPPMYPQQAKQARIQGTVELLASIDKDGDISAVKVLSGDKTLALAASDAVKHWKYKPYLLDGQPVEIQTQITVNFKLPQ